jgi:hypothetical protein
MLIININIVNNWKLLTESLSKKEKLPKIDELVQNQSRAEPVVRITSVFVIIGVGTTSRHLTIIDQLPFTP